MPTLKEGSRLDDVVLHEAENHYSRDIVDIGAGADLDVGTIVGEITATKIFVQHDPAAVDGSEVVAGVLVTPAKAATVEVKNALIIARIAQLKRHDLIFHASIDTEAERDAAVSGLKDIGLLAVN